MSATGVNIQICNTQGQNWDYLVDHVSTTAGSLHGGDSGGPVYTYIAGTCGRSCVGAEGITSAENNTSGTVMYYSFIRNVMSHLGVQILTQPNP